MKFLVPRTKEAAVDLIARFAAIDADIALLKAERQERLAALGDEIYAKLAPLQDEAVAIRKALEPWWKRAAPALLKGKAKSVELGGYKVGTRIAAETVQFAGGDDATALAAVADLPFKSRVTQQKRVLDKKAIAALLRGKSAVAATLRTLGFGLGGGEDVFFITPGTSR